LCIKTPACPIDAAVTDDDFELADRFFHVEQRVCLPGQLQTALAVQDLVYDVFMMD
jgi:hypothetical protein